MDIHSTHPTSVQNVQEVALPFETVHVLLHSLSYNFASLTLSKYTARKQEYTHAGMLHRLLCLMYMFRFFSI